jgi:hypothetical protein
MSRVLEPSTPARTKPPTDTAGTQHYTLLLFDWDDSVAIVQALRAAGRRSARRTADIIMRAHPQLAGYQLWHRGRRVTGTYPKESPRRSPLATILHRKQRADG